MVINIDKIGKIFDFHLILGINRDTHVFFINHNNKLLFNKKTCEERTLVKTGSEEK